MIQPPVKPAELYHHEIHHTHYRFPSLPFLACPFIVVRGTWHQRTGPLEGLAVTGMSETGVGVGLVPLGFAMMDIW